MEKILVGLSGGVDSAVAAYLLKQQGYDVTCAFMRNWDSITNDDILGNPTLNEDRCTQEKDYEDAKKVADQLNLPLLRVDFINEYWQEVFSRFLEEYKKGRTPNPDILCNKYIKFDHFRKFAAENGFDLLATGHYAKIGRYNGRAVLMKADDRNKDQSYFLAQISRDAVEHAVFPLAELSKPEIRETAEKLGLSVAKKKDSTGICFIGERHFRQFLSNYLPMKPGKIRLITNKETVGEHEGVFYYTIGQRKGLNIGGTGPYYVIGKDVARNELYVTDEEHQEWLYSDHCRVNEINQLMDVEFPVSCTAKFRYRQPDIPVRIEKQDDEYEVFYPDTCRSVTPGQEAVFYYRDMVLAGGVINRVYRNGVDQTEEFSERMKSDHE